MGCSQWGAPATSRVIATPPQRGGRSCRRTSRGLLERQTAQKEPGPQPSTSGWRPLTDPSRLCPAGRTTSPNRPGNEAWNDTPEARAARSQRTASWCREQQTQVPPLGWEPMELPAAKRRAEESPRKTSWAEEVLPEDPTTPTSLAAVRPPRIRGKKHRPFPSVRKAAKKRAARLAAALAQPAPPPPAPMASPPPPALVAGGPPRYEDRPVDWEREEVSLAPDGTYVIVPISAWRS